MCTAAMGRSRLANQRRWSAALPATPDLRAWTAAVRDGPDALRLLLTCAGRPRPAVRERPLCVAAIKTSPLDNERRSTTSDVKKHSCAALIGAGLNLGGTAFAFVPHRKQDIVGICQGHIPAKPDVSIKRQQNFFNFLCRNTVHDDLRRVAIT